MQLRAPPQPTTSAPAATALGGAPAWWWRAAMLAALLGLSALVWWRTRPEAIRAAAAAGAQPEALVREVASKLSAAGARQEAAALYERYLEEASLKGAPRAKVALSVAQLYLDAGLYERGLRWLYEAESAAVGQADLDQEIGRKIVHTLEVLGRGHAAQAALAARVQWPSTGSGEAVQRGTPDPVVARVGQEEIRRSTVLAALDEMPPEVTQHFSSSAAGRQELLRKYVADELLLRKATKLEYDRDPQVRRRQELARQQILINALIEKELAQKIKVDPADLESYFAANKERYQDKKDPKKAVPLAEVRPAVERDYRLMKLQGAYRELIDQEVASSAVQLFPEQFAPEPAK